MIYLNGVTKTNGHGASAKLIVDNATIYLTAEKGLAVLGRNGCGKSTLVRMLAGIEMPDAGEITPEGTVSWPLGMSSTFQGSLTGRENCRFVARIYDRDLEQVEDYVEDFAELGKSFDAPVGNYSSGMRARLAFGLSLAIDFSTYLIDELTAVGDHRFKLKSQAAFTAKAETSRVIMVTHSASTVRDYCDKAVILNDGKFEPYDDIHEAYAAYRKVVGA